MIYMECLTPKQVKEILNVGQVFVYELFNSKDFPSFKICGSWRVKKEDFDKWLENQKKK